MAIVDISTLTFDTIEYCIDAFDIIIDGKSKEILTANIRHMYLEKDFDNLNLPIFIVTLAMPDSLYYNIRANSTKTKFRINMSSRKRVDEGGKTSKKSKYISDDFNVLGADGNLFIDEDIDKKIEEAYGGENNNMSDFGNEHTFILGQRSTMNNIKKVRNKVLTSSTMTDAVTYLLGSCGIKNVLMSIMDNATSYNELLLLPIPLLQQLNYLNGMYGFYKEGAQIFFDFDTSYILRNVAKCTAYKTTTEPQDIIFGIFNSSSGNAGKRGSCIDKNVGYINVGDGNNFDIQDRSETSDAAGGVNTIILNDNSSSSTTNVKNDGSYNVITTNTHNKYYNKEVETRLKELDGIITLSLTNIDLKLLTPNKNFRIVSNDSKIAKKVNYNLRLSKYVVEFAKEGDGFTPVIIATLYKSKG